MGNGKIKKKKKPFLHFANKFVRSLEVIFVLCKSKLFPKMFDGNNFAK